ncbi:chemotaxis protein CheW [Falcatimonas sp. MSJ-15]|uniref:chemotaxis protein CheW n=1 Tax=Falcatimonas sp. MSJ-15 TaxID=2841515 RepID=UPI001C0FF952|nr:chemotaxis protein CheW [Falcatimonas sp. MSJ-15]MBU5469645.1 chemotaxis protein CheW [Falcatimonas sp. MSJ-15]
MEDNKIAVSSKQFIVVKIDNEQFGINIEYVDNIVRMQKITRVPKAQHYFKGVINLRGEIIPVMSIRLKSNLKDDVYTDKTRIIILKPEQQAVIGMLVDEVKEVVTLEESEIEKIVADNNADEKTSYINGIGKSKGELISLLNIQGVISDKETM